MAFRTDLAIEALENNAAYIRQFQTSPRFQASSASQASQASCAPPTNQPTASKSVEQRERKLEGFSVREVTITNEQAAQQIGKPCGHYLTLELDALIRREEDAFPRACRALRSLLHSLLPKNADDEPILIIGLGNRSITPDAIGPQAVDHVIATRHLVEQVPDVFADWRPVSALAPGVLGQTGVETGEIVAGVLERIRPSAVLAIDALAAGRLSRLLRTVQLADTGITPGAGVGNARSALNQETLGVPVIAIGVPTVVDGATLAQEIQQQMHGANCEALIDLSRPVMITTRDIDREVTDISRVIGYAINMALHPHLTVEDIDLYLS